MDALKLFAKVAVDVTKVVADVADGVETAVNAVAKVTAVADAPKSGGSPKSSATRSDASSDRRHKSGPRRQPTRRDHTEKTHKQVHAADASRKEGRHKRGGAKKY